jgi:hypothetical protein
MPDQLAPSLHDRLGGVYNIARMALRAAASHSETDE